ncbi:RNA polymerase sigma-70 factor (ECF subfamily) [Bacillus pakistanensis]|uniref:RNA polymerase sigma-70 factor (ECF subfamily) n=1 Tax=Rossellomorea pakistanensis TaxID=992288 RepID=A0ABS2NES6_9BACI|nr:RNA polymerase sigma factor [Bacillus pakistanensis]MBM7586264.1 RNA polymerase sigma-70 factor (ECF subfamily) [Bacillus pakistanensis]
MDDQLLIQQAQKGNLTAYGELIQKYSPVVERFAYQMGNSMDDIPDISQEVFIRVYRFLHQFSHSRFTTWLYKITLNVSRDYGRQRNQLKSKLQKLQNEPIPQVSTLTDEQIFREEEDRILHHCIHNLDEKYQLPIILHYFHEKKYEEIAEILSLNLSTVKTRLLRGKAILKQALIKAEGEEGTING